MYSPRTVEARWLQVLPVPPERTATNTANTGTAASTAMMLAWLPSSVGRVPAPPVHPFTFIAPTMSRREQIIIALI